MRRNRGRAGRRSLGRDGLDHFEVEIGRPEGELALVGADQEIGQDRNGVTPLHHAMDVPDRLEERSALDRNLHIRPHSAAGAG